MAHLSRRSFIKLTGVTAATVAAAAGTRSLLDGSAAPRSRGVVQAAATLEEKRVRTACALCPSGCGLEVRVVDGRAVKVEGSAIHPVNQGVCCLRAQASLEMLYSPERIERPLIRNAPKTFEVSETSKVSTTPPYREVSWDEALALVAGKLAELRAAGQAHTVAFLHGNTRGSMRASIERFMAYYGSPNTIALEGPGEQAARLATFLSQGINGYPAYDLNNASYIMAFGGNTLESNRHVITALAAVAFMRRGRPQRGKFVAVHPRLSLTGVKADEWVPIRPGTYAALALGMANVIINSGLYDAAFVRDFTFGFEDFTDAQGVAHLGFRRLVLERYPLERVEFITGVPAADIARLAGEFASNRPAVALLPLEPDGLDLPSALAVNALNALVGSIDAKGGVLTQRFPELAPWPDAPLPTAASLAQPRLDAIGANPFEPLAPEALAGRLAADAPYGVNALFLYNTNPVYESPVGGKMAEALLKVPFVVSFASTLDESAAHADVILPASTFLEIWGDDFVEGVGYAGVSLRQPIVEPVHDTRNPGDVLLALAARLGDTVAQALPFGDYKALCEHRRSAIDTDWDKFGENGVWSELVYFYAQGGSKAWGSVVGRDRLLAPKDGRFDFFARELYAILDGEADPAAVDLACLPGFTVPAEGVSATDYPFLLVTQDLITRPRTWWGVVPTLQESYGLQSNMKWTTWVELSPRAAAPLGLRDHDRVWVESPAGRVQATVRLYEGLWPNAVYLPPGQGHRTRITWGRGSQAPTVIGANVNALLAGNGVTRVRITKV